MKIKYTAVASGSGKLKSGEINEFTKNVPDTASISVDTIKAVNQLDNDRWSLSADWEENIDKPLKPELNYAPGVRETTGELKLKRSADASEKDTPQFWGSGHP